MPGEETAEQIAAREAAAEDAKALPGTVAELTKAVGGIVSSIESLQQNMAKLQAQPLKKEDEEEEDESNDEEEEEVDDKTLETLPRKQFADHIIKKVSMVVEKQLKTVSKSTADVKDEVARERVEKAVMEVAGKHPDFWDWSKEIKEIAEASPGISAARAYKLARMENPDKAKQVDEKHKAKDNEAGEKKGAGAKPKFGGFTPGSGNTQQNSKMAKSEAAEKAWEETMGSLGTGEGT